MTPQRYESEELDDDSLAYLHAVRDSGGRGTPGVFLSEKVAGVGPGALPLLGAIGGVVLLLLALLLSYALLWRNPLNVAMLAAALTFLGGWLIVAFVRRLIRRGSYRQIGHFKYVDPQYLWEGTGGGVVVTSLAGLQEARCRHAFVGRSYAHSNVRFVTEQGAFDVKVKSEELAEALEAYVNELVIDRGGPPLERGYGAVKRARVEDAYDPRNRRRDEEDEQIIAALPQPQKARDSYGWVVRYAAVVVGLALTFVVSYLVCRAWRDGSVYAEVKGKNPPELRVYLADPQNTSHRAEVVAELKRFHDRLADTIEKSNGDPRMRQAMANLIRAVHDRPAPVITMAFARTTDPNDKTTMEGILGPLEAATMSRSRLEQLGRDLPNWFRDVGEHRGGMQIGDQIVSFEEARGGAFAMILISVKLVRPEPADAPDALHNRIEWKVRFQRSASAEDEKEAVTVSWGQDVLTDDPNVLRRQLRKSCEEFPTTFRQYLQSMPIPAAK